MGRTHAQHYITNTKLIQWHLCLIILCQYLIINHYYYYYYYFIIIIFYKFLVCHCVYVFLVLSLAPFLLLVSFFLVHIVTLLVVFFNLIFLKVILQIYVFFLVWDRKWMNYDWWVGGEDLWEMGEGHYIQKKNCLKKSILNKKSVATNQWIFGQHK